MWQKQRRAGGKRTKGGDLCQKRWWAGEKRTKHKDLCQKLLRTGEKRTKSGGSVAKAAAGRRKAHKQRWFCVKSSGGQTESAQNTGFLCARMAGEAWWKRQRRARSNYMPGTLPEERPYRAVEGRLAGKVPPLKGDLARFCLAKRFSEPRNAAEKQWRRGGTSEAGCCAGWIWLLAALAGWLLETSCTQGELFDENDVGDWLAFGGQRHTAASRAGAAGWLWEAGCSHPKAECRGKAAVHRGGSYLIRTMLGTRRWPAWSKRWLSQGLETTPWARVQSVLEPPPSRFRAFSRPSRRAIRAVS